MNRSSVVKISNKHHLIQTILDLMSSLQPVNASHQRIRLTEIQFPLNLISFEVFNFTFIYINIILKKGKSIIMAVRADFYYQEFDEIVF